MRTVEAEHYKNNEHRILIAEWEDLLSEDYASCEYTPQ